VMIGNEILLHIGGSQKRKLGGGGANGERGSASL
jgi:hypothetical protein